MANNIGYFEIPANNIDRAKHFYRSLLCLKIESTSCDLPTADSPHISHLP